MRPHADGSMLITHRIPLELRRSLTPAELEVARLIADSFGNAEIAVARGTAERTTANQIAALYKKLRVRCRRELVLRLYGGSLLPIDRGALSPLPPRP